VPSGRFFERLEEEIPVKWLRVLKQIYVEANSSVAA
jgi:hypothetical protein